MKPETKKLMEEMAEKEDSKDYSSCSDSSIVIGFRKGFTAAHTLAEQEISQLKTSLKSAVDALENLELYSEYRPTDARVNERIMLIHKALTELKAKHPDMFKGEE